MMRADVQLSRIAAYIMKPPSPEVLAAVAAANGDGARGGYVTIKETDSLRNVVPRCEQAVLRSRW